MPDAPADTRSSFRVRRGRSYDLNAVVDLYGGCGLAPSPRGFRNELERKLINDPELFLVAVDSAGGDVIGAMSAGFDGRAVTISRLATHPAHRRRGVASELVAQLEQALEHLGAASSSVVVLDDTVDGRRFWTAVGYDDSGRVPVYERFRD